MSASPAQVAANKANAAKSTGPKTVEGKETSRANSLKHGLTGAGVVMPDRIIAEVNRRSAAFVAELAPSGEVGVTLIRHAAMLSVRMEACFERETAAIAENVRKTMAEFEAPEGVDDAQATRLRSEAGQRAMFDPSPEACLARKYENAAERGFFRALKELRLIEKVKSTDSAFDAAMMRESMGSFLQQMGAPVDVLANLPGMTPAASKMPASAATPPTFPPMNGPFDVPFTIGRRS